MTDAPHDSPTPDLSFISAHLLTCPARAASCAATLARWDATDWGKAHGRPRVHVDDQPEDPDAAWGDPRRGQRIVRAFARFLAAAVEEGEFTAEAQRAQREFAERNAEARPPEPNSSAPRPLRLCGESPASDAGAWLLLLEDDLDFHPRIAAAVASWAALDGAVMASLFNPGLSPDRRWGDRGMGRSAADPAPPTSPSPHLPIASARSFPADPATFLGAQALLLSRSFARRALAHWDDVTGMQSQRLAKLHQRFHPTSPIRVHRPSLVQHLPVDGGSAWGARVQQALDFNPAWSPDRA